MDEAGELAGRPGPAGCRDRRRSGWLVGLGSWLVWLAGLADLAGLAQPAVEITGEVAGWLAWGAVVLAWRGPGLAGWPGWL